MSDPRSEPTPNGDFSRLRANGSLTIEELREFATRLKGRSPGEMLGVVASSGLLRSLVVATVGCVVVIGVLTAIPYLYAKVRGDDAAAKVATQLPATPPAAVPATNPNPGATPNAVAPVGVDPAAAADRMGINEVKDAPTDANPRETDLDKLLDGIE